MHWSGLNREKRILQLFDRGDPSAMDRLYAEFAGYLTGVCYRYIPDDADMKDVLQESFIKIFTRIGTFTYRGEGSLQAWMTRIVINESLLWLRRKAASNTLRIDERRAPDLPEETEPEVERLDGEVLAGMIRRLPAGYRTVFNLYAVEGKSHREIARLLGIRPDTSASQFYRARQLLARMVREYQLKNR